MEDLVPVLAPLAVAGAAAAGVFLGRLSRRKPILPGLPPVEHEHEWTTMTRRGWHCTHCGAVSKRPKG